MYLAGQIKRIISYLRMREISPALNDTNNDEIRLFVKVKNEAERLPYFFEHYEKLGVDRIFLIDNNSSDKTSEIALLNKKCQVFHISEPLNKHSFWINILLHRFGRGHWCIVVDADELLVFPKYQSIGLKGLKSFLEKNHFDAVQCLLLDMYADKPICDAEYVAGTNPIDLCNYYDPNWNYFESGRPCGGVRFRVFGTKPALDKVPFFYFTKKVKLSAGGHLASNVRISDIRLALLHFKFFSNFAENAEYQASSETYWGRSYEYKEYVTVMRKFPRLNLRYAASEKYSSPTCLIRSGVIKTTDAFDNWVESC